MCDAGREVFSSIAVQVIDFDLAGELRTCIAWSETQLLGNLATMACGLPAAILSE
jgi:hypothetical protein